MLEGSFMNSSASASFSFRSHTHSSQCSISCLLSVTGRSERSKSAGTSLYSSLKKGLFSLAYAVSSSSLCFLRTSLSSRFILS